MKKALKRIGICALVAVLIWTVMLISDKQLLREELIRLHVVAASDSLEDQALKLRVRDAVTGNLREEMRNFTDSAQAMEYLQQNLPKIQSLANQVLREAGCGDVATVSLCLEEFTRRVYDTFTLPAGIYQALRITIGEGEGKNWWCVVFPSLCLPATGQGFEGVAAGAGFSESLTAALEGKDGYEIRFFLLDVLGKLENVLHRE